MNVIPIKQVGLVPDVAILVGWTLPPKSTCTLQEWRDDSWQTIGSITNPSNNPRSDSKGIPLSGGNLLQLVLA